MKKENPSENAVMSNNFIKNCKNDIGKFGFNLEDYEKFLVSVEAMKDGGIVLKYPNHDMSAYRDKYTKKNEYGIGDSLILDKFKIMSSEENGKKYETGYFAPRSFWDAIYQIKTDDMPVEVRD